MPSVLIGTAGYGYDDWHGHFYPADLSKNQRLRHYVDHFSFLEVNFTYYRTPQPGVWSNMIAMSTRPFSVVVKLNRGLTHDVPVDKPILHERVHQFVIGIKPLLDHNILNGILIQFPFRFHYDPENRRYLAELTESLSEAIGTTIPLYLEFRTRDWQRGSVIREMSSRRLSLVLTDMPDLQGLPRSIRGDETLPTNQCYLRMHGRNTSTWWSGDNVSRYDYRYTTRELQSVADAIAQLSSRSQLDLITVAFNNHYRGQAPANALELSAILAHRGLIQETR